MAGPYLQSDCSIGIKKELAFGTAVTVDQHLEFNSETLQKDIQFLQGNGFRAGSASERFNRRYAGKIDISGDIVCDADSVTLATLLEAAFGTVATGGVTAPFGRLFSPAMGDNPPSYTIQKGIPLVGGTDVKAHTFTGAVCGQMQINAANDAIVEVTTSWVGKDMSTAAPLVTPAYPAASNVFHFHKGSIAIGGTATIPTATSPSTGATPVADVRDCQITLNNNFDGNGWNFGGAGSRNRAPAYGRREVTGQLTAEFDAVTLRDASLAGTGLALVLDFTAGANERLQIVLPKIGFESNVPNSNGGDVITQQFNFKAYEDAGNLAAYVLLQNAVAIV
ncbi:MAG: hypothetical protein BGO26_10280 [Actinobacteria bacterium 69-20]|nr:hypothetical protein [Actinomycetota bacterium]OJV23284.1 MAG: hypothetical protein BGO26_10280 [Actinobacteria bacterium 69-20]